MTRFARARGSKAANERTPEDSTPWEVMQAQLLKAKEESEYSKNREEAEQKRIENYERFLREQKVQKRKATWCDFPENEREKVLSDKHSSKTKNKKKKKKNKTDQSGFVINESTADINDEINTGDTPSKPKKRKEKPPQEIVPNSGAQDMAAKLKKKNKKEKNTINDSEPEKTQTTEYNNLNNNIQEHKQKKNKNKKSKKLVDSKPVRRKAINDHSFQLIINGKEVELERFDGFPIMRKDAERLKELKDSMIKKGIPKSEVQRTIKLERRRAEKALARVKKEVCYNCRKGGHILSDCPELKSKIPGADGADGVCFKCGSTEHRQFECKVQRDKEFRFATCFICKQPGHIARQCPDNPKGLYPNGGSCKLCGDVTHLRKDCPTVMDKKEESSIKLQTLDSGENIEDVGLLSNKTFATETIRKPKKIKF